MKGNKLKAYDPEEKELKYAFATFDNSILGTRINISVAFFYHRIIKYFINNYITISL